MKIETVLIWLLGVILWGMCVKITNKDWVKIMFGINIGVFLMVLILFVAEFV